MSKNHLAQTVLETIEKHNGPIYFKDFTGKEFLTITQNGIPVTARIKSEQVKAFLINTIIEHKLGRSSSHILDSIIGEMYAKAVVSDIVKKVYIRTGLTKDNKVVIDLGGNRFCYITDDGYEIKNYTDVPFWRPNKMLPLPDPKEIEIPDFIVKFTSKLNLEVDEEYLLLLTCILKSYVQHSGAHIIMILQGLQGCGKTTLSNFFKRLTDPTSPLLFSLSPNSNDLLTTANSSHFLAFDNISYITPEMADAFCRLVTGSGISKRGLFTDDEERSYDLIRAVLFNGIEELTGRADFLDRACIVMLKKLLDEDRKSEVSLNAEFEEDYPYLMGGIFKLLALVLRELPSIRKNNLPRMTEFSRYGMALEKVLNLAEGTFLKIYENNINEKSDNAFWNDEVCCAIYKSLTVPNYYEGGTKVIKGTMTEIKDMLRGASHGGADKFQIPKKVKAFGGHLKRIEPLLNAKGIGILKLQRSSKKKGIEIRFTDEKTELLKRETLEIDLELSIASKKRRELEKAWTQEAIEKGRITDALNHL